MKTNVKGKCKRLVKNLVAAGRGIVAREVPVADWQLVVGSW